MNLTNPRQITIAREAKNMTQQELTEKLSEQLDSFYQGDLSKIERGTLKPKDETVNALSKILDFPIDFFYQEDVRPELSNLYYRKKYDVNGKSLKYLRANVSIITRAIGYLMDGVDLKRHIDGIKYNLDDSWSATTAARSTREILGIPKGPINNIVNYIEKSGIIVYLTDFDIEGYDGITAITENGWPIIFINKFKSNDRTRMNIAHELGHIVLHIPFIIEPVRNEEAEAKEYASEFLMPTHDIKSDLIGLNYNKLCELKEYWKASKASILYKAYKIGIIEKGTYIYLKDELGRRNERINETGFVDIDSPSLLNKIITLYKENGHTDNDLAELTRLSVNDFNKYFNHNTNQAKLRKIVRMV